MGDVKKISLNSSCRICLGNNKPLCPLFKYKFSGNYAEMLTAIADVKVSSEDGLPDKICTKCCTALEKAFLLKTIAERSDRRLRKYKSILDANIPTKKIAFDSLTDIKSEIGDIKVKKEPKWEMEIEVLTGEASAQNNNEEVKDIVIANTVIRKVDGKSEDSKVDFFDDEANVSWKTIKSTNDDEHPQTEYLDDDFFNNDDDDDDYTPPKEKKTKFKKPKPLADKKLFKGKRILGKIYKGDDSSNISLITCYPVTRNGSKGPPILLKRPKDATVLKVHPSYKSKTITVRDKPLRVVRSTKQVNKPREKLVCPVCGILTYTLGNHMSTHEEKKRYSCSECPKTFSQKTNLATHMKQHSGIKDHICEICGAGFYCQKGLLRHNLIHKGERPYGCTLCPKRFIAKQSLQNHVKIHYGVKNFKCDICLKTFTQAHHLKNHELTHTGDRPFSCQVCSVAFSYKVNLNNHVLKVHGINLKFKSIHTVTSDVLRKEMELTGESRIAVSHILPQISDVPPPAAHETVTHTSSDYV